MPKYRIKVIDKHNDSAVKQLYNSRANRVFECDTQLQALAKANRVKANIDACILDRILNLEEEMHPPKEFDRSAMLQLINENKNKIKNWYDILDNAPYFVVEEIR